MAAYFVDSSALAKRYVNEAGSSWLRSVLDPGTGAETFIARLTAVELIAAITRRERGGTLTPAHAVTARGAFRADYGNEFQIIEITDLLIERAMTLAENHGLRAYDALQLAAALEVNALSVSSGLPELTLISSDLQLNAAAVAEGLAVEDPNIHP